MKKTAFLLWLTVLFLTVPLHAQTGNTRTVFEDDFSKYENGSAVDPAWLPVKGVWKVVNGEYVQNSREYDCGAMLGMYLDRSFSLSADVRHISGEPGAGFFFFSEKRKNTANSHMLRFESYSSFMFGHFVAANYNAVETVPLETEKNERCRITLKVDTEKKTYSFFVNGRQVGADIPLVYFSGYVGLQSSGCTCAFDNVKITVDHSAPKANVIPWIRNFAVDADGQFLVPHGNTVLVYSSEGIFTEKISISNEDIDPLEVVTDEKCIAVLDSGRGVIYRRNSKTGKTTRMGKGVLDSPADFCLDDTGNFIVVDGGCDQIVVIGTDGKITAAFGEGHIWGTESVTYHNGKIYLANSRRNMIDVFSFDGHSGTYLKSVFYGAQPCGGIAAGKDLYIITGNKVIRFSEDGKRLNAFAGKSLPQFKPADIELSGNKIFVSDFFAGKIAVTNTSLDETYPQTDFPSPSEADITFRTLNKSVYQISIYDSSRIIFAQGKTGLQFVHAVHAGGLKPAHSYRIGLYTDFSVLPEETAETFFTFTTPPEEGEKQYMYFPCPVLIFSRVTDKRKMKPEYPEIGQMPETEKERLLGQLNETELFYWVTSNMNFFLDLIPVFIDKKYDYLDVVDSSSYYYPNHDLVKEVLRSNGMNIPDYSGIVYIICNYMYDEQSGKYVLEGPGGGFTSGVGSGKGYGFSWWRATAAWKGSGNNWLITHEFNHQLDELFLKSGHPEYWFNHLSPSLGNVGDFGEHFDANAFIMRRVPHKDWFDLKYGIRKLTADKDNDGIADNDPFLPLDEMRLNSSPETPDTDGDGVSDFDEVQFSNWIRFGVNETYCTAGIIPDPSAGDTDGDGLPDGSDTEPLLPLKTGIRYGALNLISADNPTPDEKYKLGSMEEGNFRSDIYMSWNDEAISFVFAMNRLVPLKLMTVNNPTGWFAGKDNYFLETFFDSTETYTDRFRLFDGSNVRVWPQFNKAESAKIKPYFRQFSVSSRKYVVITYKKNFMNGLFLEPGEEISLNIGFQTAYPSSNKRYVTVQEPNSFFKIRLRKD